MTSKMFASQYCITDISIQARAWRHLAQWLVDVFDAHLVCALSPRLGFASWRSYDCIAVARLSWCYITGFLRTSELKLRNVLCRSYS